MWSQVAWSAGFSRSWSCPISGNIESQFHRTSVRNLAEPNNFPHSDVKLREKVVPKLVRNLTVSPQNLIKIHLSALVKPSFHGAEGQRQVHRK